MNSTELLAFVITPLIALAFGCGLAWAGRRLSAWEDHRGAQTPGE